MRNSGRVYDNCLIKNRTYSPEMVEIYRLHEKQDLLCRLYKKLETVKLQLSADC